MHAPEPPEARTFEALKSDVFLSFFSENTALTFERVLARGGS